MDVHGINDVRQMDIHTAEPLVPEPSAFEVELAIEKLKSHRSPDIDHIPAELIKAGVGQFTIRFVNLLFLFGVRRNCLRSGRGRSLRQVIKQIVVIIRRYQSNQLHTKFYPTKLR